MESIKNLCKSIYACNDTLSFTIPKIWYNLAGIMWTPAFKFWNSRNNIAFPHFQFEFSNSPYSVNEWNRLLVLNISNRGDEHVWFSKVVCFDILVIQLMNFNKISLSIFKRIFFIFYEIIFTTCYNKVN